MNDLKFDEKTEKAFRIIDNEEAMREKVFSKKGNPKLLESKVGEMKFLRKFIRMLIKALSKVSDSKNGKVYLGLREESWNTVFKCVLDSEIEEEDNFWDIFQSLKNQFDIKKNIKKFE